MGRQGLLAALIVMGSAIGLLSLASSASGFAMKRESDGSPAVISPVYTAQPIEVVEWVDPEVAPADEAWVTGVIRQALDLWENVPTSNIRFTTTIVHGPTQPPKECGQLTVGIHNIGHQTGPETFPESGCAGTWSAAFGNVAPPFRDSYYLVAAHEIGHTLGFMHSTVSSSAFGSNIPIMHWAAAPVQGLTEDDAAAASVAYPDPNNPLGASTGSINGRAVDQASLPLDGVNVIAVNAATGKPTVGRVSGSDGESPGRFDVVGLPPGTYNLEMLDGHSTGGLDLGLEPSSRFQADNFDPPPLGQFVVTVGSVRDLGDIALQIKPMAIHPSDAFVVGVPPDYNPAYDELPDAVAGQPYNFTRFRLDGGVRPLTPLDTTGLPAGLSAAMEIPAPDKSAPQGVAKVEISGTAQTDGPVWPTFHFRDAHGNDAFLTVPWLAPTFTGTTPTSPNVSTTPLIEGTAAAGSTVKLYTNSACTGSAVATGSAATFASPGIQVTVSGTTTFYGTATDSIDTSACSFSSITYTVSGGTSFGFLTMWGTKGNASSPGGQFNKPTYVATNASGSAVYVADSYNKRIQKFDANGNFVFMWGSSGGPSSSSGHFNRPAGLAVNAAGEVYVVDSYNKRVQKFDANGNFISMWGTYGTASSTGGHFNKPSGIAISGSTLYVADTYNKRVQKFDLSGNFIGMWGTYGNATGEFNRPIGLATDSSGYIYVVDSYNKRIQKFNLTGNFVSTFGSYGTALTSGGHFFKPTGIATNGPNVYIGDTYNNRVQKFGPTP